MTLDSIGLHLDDKKAMKFVIDSLHEAIELIVEERIRRERESRSHIQFEMQVLERNLERTNWSPETRESATALLDKQRKNLELIDERLKFLSDQSALERLEPRSFAEELTERLSEISRQTSERRGWTGSTSITGNDYSSLPGDLEKSLKEAAREFRKWEKPKASALQGELYFAMANAALDKKQTARSFLEYVSEKAYDRAKKLASTVLNPKTNPGSSRARCTVILN